MPIFKLALAIPVKSHVWKFGLDWLSLSSYLNFPWGQKPPIRGVACDLQCPFSNLAELFQSKIICVNLVRIGWALQELSCPQTFFYGGRNPLLGGAYIWPVMPIFLTRMSYSSQKSCMEIWFGLVEIRGMLILRGALHVTCDAHFLTWPKLSR